MRVKKSTRHMCVCVLQQVVQKKHALDDVLETCLEKSTFAENDQAFIRSMSYGVLRHYEQLTQVAQQVLKKPLKTKDLDVYLLLLTGVFQLNYMRVPAHAAVSESVNVTHALGKSWAKALINGCLRAVSDKAIQSDLVAYPAWLEKKLRKAYPDDATEIMRASLQQPPMWLRVHVGKQTKAAYLQQFGADTVEDYPDSDTAIRLHMPLGVAKIPGFVSGDVSVQDVSGQFCASLLDVVSGDWVLDACAAPGSKTAAILEKTPTLEKLVALDKSEKRLMLLKDNIERLCLPKDKIRVCAAEAEAVSVWTQALHLDDAVVFDKILLDAPCSATGVIRRHPDIKFLRKASDVTKLVAQQQALLSTLLQRLKPGGRLLYTTCSVLPEENDLVVGRCIQENNAISSVSVQLPTGRKTPHGWQLLPGEANADGFYYALLTRT